MKTRIVKARPNGWFGAGYQLMLRGYNRSRMYAVWFATKKEAELYLFGRSAG